MEVTIWIERTLGLSVVKHMPHGSTIANLKEAVLTEDLFGSLSIQDLTLIVSGSRREVLDDGLQLSEGLSEFEIGLPADDAQAGAPEGEADVNLSGCGMAIEEQFPGGDTRWPAHDANPDVNSDAVELAPCCYEVVVEEFPKRLGGELKWYVWNVLWHAVNQHAAEYSEPAGREDRLTKAAGDRQRLEGHFEAATSMELLSVETLQRLREQAEAAGRAGAAAFLDGHPLHPEAVDAAAPPSELGPVLWSKIVSAIRLAAAAACEMNLSDSFKEDPKLQWWHWMKGGELQKDFESAWHKCYDSPPTPPPEEVANSSARVAEDWREQASYKEAVEQEAARKQAELEQRALEMKDTVQSTANGARKLLGTPLAYSVLRDCALYSEPMPQATRAGSITAGAKIWGYPGSAAWIRLDPRASGLLKEAMSSPQLWVPVRSMQGVERELVLHALWHELQATRTLSDSIDVRWPGVDQPVEPNVAEYAVEVRAKDSPAAGTAVAISGTTKTRTLVRGLDADTEVQIRVKLRLVGPYSVDFRLAGPWTDFRTAQAMPDDDVQAPQGASDATPAGADEGGGVEIEGIYEVVHAFVTLRGEPTTKGTILGTLKQGACVFGVRFQVGEESWIRLSAQTIPPAAAGMPPRDIAANEGVFILTDATPIPSLKLGVLLKRLGDATASDDKKKLGEWKVLHDRVVVRAKASVDAAPMGYQKKGSKVLGVCMPIAGVDWLRVRSPALEGGMQSPDAWMLIDGSAFGHGQLLERLGDAPPDANPRKVRTLPRSSTRPPPPRPLTVPWLAAHGGLPVTISAVHERPLEADLDVGMASDCALLYVQPADGRHELSYVAKRGPEFGDMGCCGREYRFYQEIARYGVKAGQPCTGMLGEVMRVPHCHCANWGKEGKEREGFILIMERLDGPDWVSVDPELGCTHEQAITAVETLGRMHKAFSDDVLRQREFDWLPSTLFDVRNAAHIQNYFTSILSSAQPLVQMLPPGARHTVEAMAEGGLGECFERLAEHPLCLNHGDYRPENLRFSAPGRPPAVAVFDWGLVNVARGIADFAYFVMLSQPPEERRQRERELLERYLQARGDKCGGTDEAWTDLKSASIAILGMILMTRHGAQVGHKQGTRNMLSRMMRWVGAAITDWHSIDVLDAS